MKESEKSSRFSNQNEVCPQCGERAVVEGTYGTPGVPGRIYPPDYKFCLNCGWDNQYGSKIWTKTKKGAARPTFPTPESESITPVIERFAFTTGQRRLRKTKSSQHYLLSHLPKEKVSSAQRDFTTEFGMGSGGSLSGMGTRSFLLLFGMRSVFHSIL